MKKILIIIIAMLIAVPAFAFEVFKDENKNFDFYGSLRFTAAYYDRTASNTTSGGVTKRDPDSQLFKLGLQDNSRFGFKFGFYNLSGVVELSTALETGSTDTSRLRLAYATYNFGDFGKLSIGKMPIPGTSNSGNIYINDHLTGYGAILTARRNAIMYTIFDAELYLISVDADLPDFSNLGSLVGNSASNRMTIRTKENLPRFELAYNLPKVVNGKVFASYATVAIENSRDTNILTSTTTNAQTYHLGAAVKPKFGDFQIAVSAMYGANFYLNNYKSGAFISPLSILDKNNLLSEVRDALTYGVLIAPRYNITDWFAAEVGFGYQSTWITKIGSEKKDTTSDGMAIYGQLVFRAADYFIITPQVGYYKIDKQTDSGAKSASDLLFVGVQLRADF